MTSISNQSGAFLARLARESLRQYVTSNEKLPLPPNLPPELIHKSGVYVTINDAAGNLRGCMGNPNPTHPIASGVIDAAIQAGTRDPRFPPVRPSELSDLKFEVTVLTPPEPVRAASYDELLGKITIGKDGLIAQRGGRSALFLPQVPTEWGWDKETYYRELCDKAGIPLAECKDMKTTKVSKFQGTVFKEKSAQT